MLKYATPELYAELDKIGAQYKERILLTKTEISYTGTAYYVSENGCDDNDGLSPKTAWRTNAKVSEAALCEGDAVLFERGGLFRGQIKTISRKSMLTAKTAPSPKSGSLSTIRR